MAIVYLGLGSNVGDRRAFLAQAVAEMEEFEIDVRKISSIIETKPVGGPIGQDKYLNAVLECETDLSPEDLLEILQSIEHKLGRVRTVQDGPRTIDIDILLYDELQIKTANLTIPHPRMLNRDFVMIPLKEIAPQIAKDFVRWSS